MIRNRIRYKLLFAVALASSLTIITLLFFSGNSTLFLPDESLHTKPVIQVNLKPITRNESQSTDMENSILMPTIATVMEQRKYWSERYADVKRWRDENFGTYINGDSQLDYQSYSTDILRQLADNQDFLAMHVLGFRLFDERKRDEARREFERAAVYGSTVALKMLAVLDEGSDKSSSGKRKRLLTRLSYYQAGILRGDPLLLLEARGMINARSYKLTAEDREEIEKRARKIFDGLIAARQKEGLGPFPSNTPSIVEEYYKYELGEYYELLNKSNSLAF